MKISIITIGKKDEPQYRDAIADFTRRAGHYFDIEWKILPSAKETSAPVERQKQEEGERILSKVQSTDFVVLLDERGNSVSSITFADMLSKHIDKGTKHIVCIIGGAFGVSQEVLKRANFTLSLSKLVFPHQVVRLLCIEQLYRAGTIIRGEKYHHQ